MYKIIIKDTKSIIVFKCEAIKKLAEKVIRYYSGNIHSIYNFDSEIRIQFYSEKENYIKCDLEFKDELFKAMSDYLEEEILRG